MTNSKQLTMQSLYPHQTWAKFGAKAPLVLWRLGLGPLSGRLFLVLTVTGRKSGLPRRTMVEYHRYNSKKYITSGFGEKAQWYKNIMAAPQITVQTSDGTERMQAVRVTDDDELLAVIEVFKRVDTSAGIEWYLRSYGVEPTREDIITKKDRLYFLRLDPTDESTPPGLEVDLAWLWPVALLGLLGLWMLKKLIQ
jgi:deazaflavin-dependent oxidoreductase (nitroreductase family)